MQRHEVSALADEVCTPHAAWLSWSVWPIRQQSAVGRLAFPVQLSVPGNSWIDVLVPVYADTPISNARMTLVRVVEGVAITAGEQSDFCQSQLDVSREWAKRWKDAFRAAKKAERHARKEARGVLMIMYGEYHALAIHNGMCDRESLDTKCLGCRCAEEVRPRDL